MSSWERENYQRNYIQNSLYDAKQDDIIIISDLDEIPNLQNFDLKKKYNAATLNIVFTTNSW